MPHPSAYLEFPSQGAVTLGLLRPRRRRRRQFLTAVVLFFLVGIICGYWVITDSNRVGPIAEHYLSKVVGGRVKVHKANLSLFEGLRLEGVEVYIGGADRPDSHLFSARALIVRTSLGGLVSGRLEAAQIMALDPHFRLCENVDADESSRWNYMLLSRGHGAEKPSGLDRPTGLPEIVLRGGVVEYSRIMNGRYEPVGSMAIDGQVTPDPRPAQANRYRFDLDSRGRGEPAGPHISGTIDMDTPSVSASLQDFEFNHALRAMLPTQVQAWCESHQLSGRVRIPRFQYIPESRGASRAFHVEVQLDGVDMAVLPEELLGSEDFHRISSLRPGIRINEPADLGLVSRSDIIDQTLQLRPVFLTNVSGRLVFTPDQVRISGVCGEIENNTVLLDGAIYGYNEDAPASLRLIANDLRIPRHPRYLASLPQVVRKIYRDFSPAGRASLFFELRRDKPGGRLKITGEAVILNGAFCFEGFPYPLRGITGRIIVGPDRATGQDRIDLVDLRCIGMEGSCNAGVGINVNGWVSPIDRGSAVEIHVAGSDVQFDQHVRRALPSDVGSVIEMFDIRSREASSPAKVIAPMELRGSFAARIRRPPGPKKKVTVDVDLNIVHGAGEFVGFPYPLRNVTGRIAVHPRYTEVKNLVARHGDSSICIEGRVNYGPDRPADPALTVTAKNIPLDNDLFLAVRDRPREWLQKGGIGGGFLDINGTIFLPPNANSSSDTDFQLEIAMRDGKIWPVGNTFAVTDAAAKLRLSSSGLIIDKITGKRGSGEFLGQGIISWPEDQPRFNVAATITNVLLDETLYQIIPAAAQRSWKLLRPEGSADLDIAYTGGVVQGADSSGKLPASAETYEAVIRPRQLAINPVAFPLRMDNITGTVTITPGKTTFQDIVLHHGPAILRLSGSGVSEPKPQWDVALSGQGVVDDAFRRAIGDTLRGFCESIKLGGPLSFDCPKLTIRQIDSPPSSDPAKPALPPATEVEIEGASLLLADGSLDTGLPFTAVNGGLRDLSVVIRDSAIRSLSAKIDVPSMELAQRPAKDFRGTLKKMDWPGVTGHNVYHFEDLQAKVAGGKLAMSQLDIDVPDKGPSMYALRLDLKDIDLRSLELEGNIHGRLNASLNLEAKWNDPASRVGRGDVLIQGKELYSVPVVFGWLQIANLAMPGKSPFTEATCTYNIQGQKLVLRPIVLRTSTVIMQGDGLLDFASKKMEMTFLTDNRNFFRIPILGDLIDVAKHELLPVHVTGTIHEPHVRVKSLRTFTTTLDQVFDRPEAQAPKTNKKKPKTPPGMVPLATTRPVKP